MLTNWDYYAILTNAFSFCIVHPALPAMWIRSRLAVFWYPAVISLLFGPFSLPKLRIPAGGGDLVADNLLQKQQKQQRTGTAGLRRATKKMYRKTQLEDDRRRFGTRFGPG
jgi:hypothetical protein